MEVNVGVFRDSLARTGLIACAWRARVLHAVGIARERVLVVLVPPTAARHRLERRDGDGRASLHLGLVGPRRVENNVRVFPVVPDMPREGARQYHRCPADDEEVKRGTCQSNFGCGTQTQQQQRERRTVRLSVGPAATEMAETYQVGDGVVHCDGTQRSAAMGPTRVARDVVELETRVELHAPNRRLKVVRRDRELGEGDAAQRAPDDDAAATLRRAVDPGLQDAEACLISVAIAARARFRKVREGQIYGGRQNMRRTRVM